MITLEASLAFIQSFVNDCNRDSTTILKVVSDLAEKEPAVIAVLTYLFKSLKFEDPMAAGMFALAIYRSLAEWQSESDKLKDLHG